MGCLLILAFFIVIAAVISFIDLKKRLIPDKVMLPSIIIMLLLKWISDTLSIDDLIAVGIVTIVFIIPIALGMAFGGGDIRFGIFCALFIGLEEVGIFIMLAGIIQLCILALVRKKSFAFAPAMTLSALTAYILG